jgi:hypothetical protein
MEPLSTSALVTIIVAISSIIVALVETGRYIIVYLLNKNKKPGSYIDNKKLAEIHCKTAGMFEIIKQRDKDSIPLVYFPRGQNEIYKNISELQHRLIELMTEMAYEQKRIAELIDRIREKLDGTKN